MQISNEEYKQLKPLLFSLGYRLLGSVNDAEDMVQETFMRAYLINENAMVVNKKAYLCKMMTNRCLDLLKSARYKREQYIGPWNPDPLVMDLSAYAQEEPSEAYLRKEGLSIAYMRMMEHLGAAERAVLLLREVFTFSYTEIAEILEKKEEHCRKLFSRAKQKLSSCNDENLDYTKNKSIIDSFVDAFQNQKMEDLLELISDNVTLFSDGGGEVHAATRPIFTRSNVLAFLSGIVKKAPDDFYYQLKTVNAQPALVCYMNGQLQSVISFSIVQERINEIYITLNPHKLPKYEQACLMSNILGEERNGGLDD
ncbi:RNA polymerase sigma-70 factor [Paenibacillus septentrionalis]|uniref:RNA polymerase sigma-70 factor n=1 Tax=Paenibacillus septentrionalis TaxID=429342 RepID=A0ABW1V5V6_9BACL